VTPTATRARSRITMPGATAQAARHTAESSIIIGARRLRLRMSPSGTMNMIPRA
jgi:hypothetical protein